MTDAAEIVRLGEIQGLMADVWVQRSQARVGSYQHEVSSAPWMVLASAESDLHRALRARAASALSDGEG